MEALFAITITILGRAADLAHQDYEFLLNREEWFRDERVGVPRTCETESGVEFIARTICSDTKVGLRHPAIEHQPGRSIVSCLCGDGHDLRTAPGRFRVQLPGWFRKRRLLPGKHSS